MSNLEVKQAMKAKLRDVIVLSQKNRQPDDNPGAKLSIEATFSNAILDFFDARLKKTLFERLNGAAKKQAELDGIEPASDLPNLTTIGAKMGWFPWHEEFSGCIFTIDFGMGGKSNLVIRDAILGNWKLIGKEGGTVVGRFTVESNDVNEGTFGKLAKLKSREIAILVDPPTVAQQELEDEDDKAPPVKPAAPRKPSAPERAAAAKAGKETKPPAPHKGDKRPARTARGKAQTKAALEAGASSTAELAQASDAAQAHIAAVNAKLDEKAAEKAAAATKAFAGDAAGAPPATLQ